MSAYGSPERRPATPQHHLKSFFNAASCTSSSGIQITPPSASRTNLLSITRPFAEESSGYSDIPESSRLGRTRTSETLMRRPEDTEGSSDDEQEQTGRRRSRIQAGLKKSSSFGSLFSPSKLHNLSRQRSKPEDSSLARDETAGDSETTRRSESPKKGLGRSSSLKERAFELISKSKRSSFSDSTKSSASPMRARTRRSTTPTVEPPSELAPTSTTPPGTPHMPNATQVAFNDIQPLSTTTKTTLLHEESTTIVTSSSYRADTSDPSPAPVPPQLSTPRPSSVELSGAGGLAAVNSLRRGILKPSETPGSGRSVRFGSRNAYRILTPTSPTTSFSSSDQLRTNLFALGRGQGADRDEDDENENTKEESTPTTGLESSVRAVGKGRPSVARMNSASSASSSGSDKGKQRQPSPAASKLNHRPSIEDRLNEFYLAGKRTLEASSSESDAPIEKSEQSAKWREDGLSTLDMPSEGAYQGSEYTDFLMDDGGKLAGFLPEASRMTEGGKTLMNAARPADSTARSQDKSFHRTSESSLDALARAELVNSIHKKREERIREESTVLGLIGDRSSLSQSRQTSKDGSFSTNQSRFTMQGSPTPTGRRGPTSSTPKMSPASRRLSSSTSRLVSTGSGQGSFDVLSHYGDDASVRGSPAAVPKDVKAVIMVDSPNLSRWSPDTTGEESARSRSVSWAANESDQGRPEISQVDESDRSIGVMIVHEEASATHGKVQQEVVEDCSVSMNDSPGTSPARPGASGKSFWDRIPKLFGAAAAVQAESEMIEERSLVLTPTKQDAGEGTMFWTPGSAFAANLSQMSAPSSPNQAAVGSEEWTKSLLSLGQALVAAEDEVIYQLKADAKRWRDLAEDLIDKSKQGKSRGKAESVAKPVDADMAAAQEQCKRLSQDLAKAKDDQREAEIQLQGMQRYYSEAKEREERWQARYELLKTSCEEEKQEKEALSIQIRDTEIKQQGFGEPDSAKVLALREEIAALKKHQQDKEAENKSFASQLEQTETRHQSQMTSSNARVATLEAELEKQQSEAHAQLTSAQSESARLRSQRDLLNVHRQDIETALKVLEEDQAGLQKQNKTLLSVQIKLSEQCATLEQEHIRIIKERDEALHLADSRVDRTAYEVALSQRDETSGQVDELSETLETLIVEMAKAVKRNASLEEQVANASRNFSELEEEKETLLRQSTTAQTERDAAVRRCDEVIVERDAALGQCQSLQETSSRLEKSLNTQRSEHNRELDTVRSELLLRQQEEVQYQHAVQYLEQQLGQAEDDHENAKLAIKEMSARAEQAGRRSADEREKYEQELDAARERFGVLDQELVRAKEENISLSGDTKMLQAKLERVASAATHSTEDMSSLQSQLEAMVADVERLKKTVQSLRQDNSTKDIQIGKLQRAREQLKEDKEMLNIALESKQQEVGLLQRKYAGSRTSTDNADNEFGDTLSAATPAASRLAMSVRRHAAARRPSAVLETPVPSQRSLGRGTPSIMQSSSRFPSVPQSLGSQADVSQVLNSSIKINRQISLGLVSTSRSSSAADVKMHNIPIEHNHFVSGRNENERASPFLP